MDGKKYEIYCKFHALGKKVVNASSLDEAIKIAESDKNIELDEIVRLINNCKVDSKLSHEVFGEVSVESNNIEFKNWGSE